MDSNIEYRGIFIHPKYFKYHGLAEKSGNSLFICLNCPSKKKNSGSLRTYSNNDKSRQNLYSHMQSEHPGLLASFKSDCNQGIKSGCKRKLVELNNEDGNVNRQITIEESLASKPKKLKMAPLTQEQFDNYLVNYITESLLPLHHVEN